MLDAKRCRLLPKPPTKWRTDNACTGCEFLPMHSAFSWTIGLCWQKRYTEEEIESCTPLVSTTITGNHMAGQNTQWRDQESNRIEDFRSNHQAKKAGMVWTCVENGWWQDSETGDILGNECNKPRTRKAEKELERYHTPRFEEHRSGLGRRRTLHLR